jgi:hypothetical protein
VLYSFFGFIDSDRWPARVVYWALIAGRFLCCRLSREGDPAAGKPRLSRLETVNSRAMVASWPMTAKI